MTTTCTYPKTIRFTADEADHVATVGEPRQSHPGDGYMTRVVDGVEYQILLLMGGGFLARPIEAV